MAKAKKSKGKKSKTKKTKAKAKKSVKRAAAASSRKTKKSKAPKSKTKRAAPKKAKSAPRKAVKAKRPAKAAKPAKSVKPAAKKAAPKKKKQVMGEGDYQASRTFLKDQSNFVKRHSAEIPKMGKDAEAALEGPQGAELRAAEEEARSHSKVAGPEE